MQSSSNNPKILIFLKFDQLFKKKNISNKDIEKTIIEKIKKKRIYIPEFISLATNMSTISQMSLESTSQCTKEMITFFTGNSSKLWLFSSTLSR